MAPKSHVLVAIAFLCALQAAFSQCDNFYSKVTYALNHCKKGMTATNFEHQMYYAERALTALEKSKAFREGCDCAKAENKTLDALETLDKAIEPIDWEAGRFFTKKALGQINELITILDECTLGVSSPVTVADNATTTMEHQAHADAEAPENAMEMEMIKVFEKHSSEKLNSAQQAIDQLVELSKTIGSSPDGNNNDPNSLEYHQKMYLENARKLLEEGLKNIGGEE